MVVTTIKFKDKYYLSKIEEDIYNQLESKQIFLLGQYDYFTISGAILTDYLYSKMLQKITSNSDFVFCMPIFLKMKNGDTFDKICSKLESEINKRQELQNYKITTQNKSIIKKKINNTLKFIKGNAVNVNVSGTIYDLLKCYVMLEIKKSNFDINSDLLFTLALVQIFKRMPKDETKSWEYIEKELKSTYLIKEKNYVSDFSDFKISGILLKKIRVKIENTIKYLKDKYSLYCDEKCKDIDDILKSQCFLTEKNYEKYFEFIQEYYRRNIYEANTKYLENDVLTKDDVIYIQSLAKAYIDAKEDKNNTNNESRNLVVNKLNDECIRRTLATADIEDLVKYVGRHLYLYEICVDNYNSIEKFLQKNSNKLKFFEKRLFEWCKNNIPPKIREAHKALKRVGINTNLPPFLKYFEEDNCFKIVIPKQTISVEAQTPILHITVKSDEKKSEKELRQGMGFTRKDGHFIIERDIVIDIDNEDIFKKFTVEIYDEENSQLYKKEIPAREYRFFGEKEEKDVATIRKNECYVCYLVCQKHIDVQFDEDDTEKIFEEDEYDVYELDLNYSNFRIIVNGTTYPAVSVLENKSSSFEVRYIAPRNYDIVPIEDDYIKRKLTLVHPTIFIDKEAEELKEYKSLWLMKVLGEEEKTEKFYEIKLNDFALQKDENGQEYYEINVEKYINNDSNLQKTENFKESSREYCLCWSKKHKAKPLEDEYYILIGELNKETGRREDPYKLGIKDLYTNEEKAIITSEEYIKPVSENITTNKTVYECKLTENENTFSFNTALYNYRFAEVQEYNEDIEDKRENFFNLIVKLNVLKYSFNGDLNYPEWHRMGYNHSFEDMKNILEEWNKKIYINLAGEVKNLKVYSDDENNEFKEQENYKGYKVFLADEFYNTLVTDRFGEFSRNIYIDFDKNKRHYHEKLFSIGEEKQENYRKAQVIKKPKFGKLRIDKMMINNEEVKPSFNHVISDISSDDNKNFSGILRIIKVINRRILEKSYEITFTNLDSESSDKTFRLNIKANNGKLCYNSFGNLCVTENTDTEPDQGIWVLATREEEMQEDY